MSEYPPELVATVSRAIWMADDKSEAWGETSRAYYDTLARAALDAITETHAVVDRDDIEAAVECVDFWRTSSETDDQALYQDELRGLYERLLAAARATAAPDA